MRSPLRRTPRTEVDTASHEIELDYPAIFRNHVFDLAEIRITYQTDVGRYLGPNHPSNLEPETDILDVACSLALDGETVMPEQILSDSECSDFNKLLAAHDEPTLHCIAEIHAARQH